MVGGGMRLTWTSWIDQGETEALGQQTLVLDSLVNTFCSIAVPNLGPYVGFTARLLAGYANYTPQLFALMTNKARPTTALPLQALWTGSGNTIAISGNTVEYAPFYYGGAAGMIVVGGSTQTTFQLQAEDSGGTWQVIWAQTVGALTIANVQPVMLPLAPLRMKVINASSTAADAAWQFQVVPDLSVV